MSWFRRTFGLDGVDLLIHAGVTFSVMAVGSTFFRQEAAEVMLATVSGISLVVLGIRRRLALKHRPREGSAELAAGQLAELEVRVAELEEGELRLHELEERLDFAERLLAGHREQGQLPRLQG